MVLTALTVLEILMLFLHAKNVIVERINLVINVVRIIKI